MHEGAPLQTELPASVTRAARSLRLAGVMGRTSRAVSLFLGLILIAAVCLNFANVLGRYVFDEAIVGAEEVQVFIMVWITFIGAAVVAWRGEHLRMDVVADRFSPRVRALLRRLEAALFAVLALFMLYQSAHFTLQMVELGRSSDALGVPMVIPHMGLVLGFALLAVVAVLRLLGVRPPEPKGEGGEP